MKITWSIFEYFLNTLSHIKYEIRIKKQNKKNKGNVILNNKKAILNISGLTKLI